MATTSAGINNGDNRPLLSLARGLDLFPSLFQSPPPPPLAAALAPLTEVDKLPRAKEAAAVSGADRREPYWNVVKAIVDIFRQSDGSGGREEDASLYRTVITESDFALLRPRGVLSPEDPYRLIWETFCGLFIVYTAFEVPYRIGFLFYDELELAGTVVEYVIVAVFLLDIMVNFCFAYIDPRKNALVYDHRRIAVQYLSTWFPFDLLSTLPFEAMVSGAQQNDLATLKIFRLIRLVRLAKLLKLLSSEAFLRILEAAHIPVQAVGVVRLLIKILIGGHVVGCFFFFMTLPVVTGVYQPLCNMDTDRACLQPVTYDTWATYVGVQWESKFSQYVTSVYWAFATLMTVGYGDVHAISVPERIFATFVMLCGACVVGTIVAETKLLVDSRNLLEHEVANKLSDLKAYMADMDAPTDVQLAALDAYRHSARTRPFLSDEGMYDILPDKLRLGLLKRQFRRELAVMHVLRGVPFQFTAALLEAFMPVQVLGGETVYRQGDVADELSFVYRGQVRLVVPDGPRAKAALGLVTAGGMCGDVEFASKGSRLATYEALRRCQLYAVRYEKLRAAVEAHPAPGKRFCNEIQRRWKLFVRLRDGSLPPDGGEIKDGNNDRDRDRSDFIPAPFNVGNDDDDGDGDKKAPSRWVRARARAQQATEPRPASMFAFDADTAVAYGVTLWLDGKLAVTQHAHREPPRNNYEEDLSPMVRLRDGELVVVDDNLMSLRADGVLHPTGRAKLVWDSLIGLLIVFSITVLPLEISFESLQSWGLQVIA
jgi:hypothetical protein